MIAAKARAESARLGVDLSGAHSFGERIGILDRSFQKLCRYHFEVRLRIDLKCVSHLFDDIAGSIRALPHRHAPVGIGRTGSAGASATWLTAVCSEASDPIYSWFVGHTYCTVVAGGGTTFCTESKISVSFLRTHGRVLCGHPEKSHERSLCARERIQLFGSILQTAEAHHLVLFMNSRHFAM